MAELGQIEIAKVPASEAKILVDKELKIAAQPAPAVVYPIVEEMVFRGVINSQEQGMALLRAIQILVTELGAAAIIQVVASIEKKPELLQKAKAYLPYVALL